MKIQVLHAAYEWQSYISVTASVFGQLSHAAPLGIFWNLYTYIAIKITSIICRTTYSTLLFQWISKQPGEIVTKEEKEV